MSEKTEAAGVIGRLQERGTDELSRLFEINRNNLRLLISSRIQGRLAARFDASDIIQETFLRANTQLRSYLKSPRIHPVVWIRILCKQLLSENVRKHMRNRRSPKFETHNVGDQLIAERLADSIHSVRESVARKELVEQVYRFLEGIESIDREIIEMRHTEAMTFPEIANVLDTNHEAVKKRYYRALDKLRRVHAQE